MSWSYEKLDERAKAILRDAGVAVGSVDVRAASRGLRAVIDELTTRAVDVARGWKAQRKSELALPGMGEPDDVADRLLTEVHAALQCARARFGLACAPESLDAMRSSEAAAKVLEAATAYDHAAAKFDDAWFRQAGPEAIAAQDAMGARAVDLRVAVAAWRKLGGAA